MRVCDVMTREVYTLRHDKKVNIVKEIMDWANVRHVPIVDEEHRVVGLVTHRDLLRASISALDSSVPVSERGQHLWQIPVSELMCTEVRTISPDMSVRHTARIMREDKIGCLPVVDDGKLVGIVTEADLLALIEHLPETECTQPQA